MRESISSSWLFGLVVGFIMIFVGYMCVMINYSTVFKLKNEAINILEKYEGVSTSPGGSLTIINNYLKNSGYNARGKCPSDMYAVESLDFPTIAPTYGGTGFYCLSYTPAVKTSSDTPTGYINIKLFLRMDIPVLGRLGIFNVDGQTIRLVNPENVGLN